MNSNHPILITAIWSTLTIAVYLASKWFHHRQPRAGTSPMITAPVLLIAFAYLLHINCSQYQTATHWLLALFAPATVAFALPIYEQRALIRSHWPLLVIGSLAGSLTAILFSWFACPWLGLNDDLRLSLLPRSVSTPFAMYVSGQIGGTPSLTATFVFLTGLFGATLGEILIICLPLRSTFARGALFGMGAHGFGAAKADQIHPETGSIAGIVMVFSGLLTVLATPLLAHFLK